MYQWEPSCRNMDCLRSGGERPTNLEAYIPPPECGGMGVFAFWNHKYWSPNLRGHEGWWELYSRNTWQPWDVLPRHPQKFHWIHVTVNIWPNNMHYWAIHIQWKTMPLLERRHFQNLQRKNMEYFNGVTSLSFFFLLLVYRASLTRYNKITLE